MAPADVVDIRTGAKPKRRSRSKAAESQRRYRERKKAETAAKPVIENDPPVLSTPTTTSPAPEPAPVSPTIPRRWSFADALAYAVAIGLASCAAFFSIKGMTVLFPAAAVPIVIMSATMEAGKLVTAGWLARHWCSTAWIWRLALAGFVFGLAVINAGGLFSQLVSAHVGERGAAGVAIETQTANLEARIEVSAHAVADLDARVAQIDAAIAEATRRGRTKTAMATMQEQQRARAALTSEREQAAGTLATLKAERASVTARGRQAEVELRRRAAWCRY
jgi:hypothetical protein